MSDFLLQLINCSIAAGWIVPIVLLLRFLLKGSPKQVSCLLWGIVGLRLLLPFSIESRFSLIPSAKTVDPGMFFGRIVVQSGIPALDLSANTYLATHYYESITVPVGFFDALLNRFFYIWLFGVLCFALYSLGSTLYLYWRTSVSLCLKENIYICDRIDTPFVLGMFRPKICLPSDLEGEQLEAVLRHEKAHLRRRDHIIKPLAYMLVIVHWFNPLLWLAFWFFSRDTELACDECAVQKMDVTARKSYSHVLLDFTVRRRKMLVSPLAFGEVGIKQRVRSVLLYRKPTVLMKIIALVLCILMSVCFLTSPLPGDRVLTLPETGTSEALIMNAMHDSLRSKANIESYLDFYSERENPVPFCEDYDGSHMHFEGTVATGKRCKICGATVYDGNIRKGVKCAYSGEIK